MLLPIVFPKATAQQTATDSPGTLGPNSRSALRTHAPEAGQAFLEYLAGPYRQGGIPGGGILLLKPLRQIGLHLARLEVAGCGACADEEYLIITVANVSGEIRWITIDSGEGVRRMFLQFWWSTSREMGGQEGFEERKSDE